MWWKIKRWWLFQLSPYSKIGDTMVFYPFESDDTLRQELVIKGIRQQHILFSYAGSDKITEMHYEDFFECYINKKFLESWGIKL